MDIYAQNVMDHYKCPRNQGEIDNPSMSGKQVNRSCGDTLVVDLKVKDDKIIDLKFQGQGCAISQAAMSILSESIIDQTIEQVLILKHKDVLKLLGVEVGQRRFKCVLLGLLTVQNIILRKQKKPERVWNDFV
ncbi:iron-sulfur cluster assembly scaffold protein [bacterium]|jgi:nitrogen fixation protein NifU and related proteins|nr:iron-sulfur cluster assembly scaffold protein [bacterium]MBT4649135.1 iron-sulfur cluster assembly scaffold protein [bacterium]